MRGDRADISRVAAHCAWLLLSLPDALAYRRALRAEVAETQATVLRDILRRNAETDFGRQHRFEKVRGIRDFRTSVPLTTYADYTEAIERIGFGQAGVLSSAPVTVLEPTSGSTSATKYVPYTRRLERQFQQALAPWMVDLYSRHPHLVDGQAYWSISPVGGEHQRTSSGIPIGFADDSAYLGGARGALVRSMLAVPPAIRLIPDVAAFRYATLLFLLRSRRLALVSVWSPSFLQLLCRPLPDWWPRLADDIQDGRLTPPVPIPPAVLRQLSACLPPDPARAAEIRAIFARHADQPAAYHRALWPNLRLISCWADGSAAEHARDLARLFPGAHIQPKGLVATEGIVTIPVGPRDQHALAVRSHFFEFIPRSGCANDDSAAEPSLAHQLEQGKTYEVVLTTDVFYRYRLRDLVQVVGHVGSVPTLRFIGKTDLVSDVYGEKLNERHVRAVVRSATSAYAAGPGFALLAYDDAAHGPGYVLFVEWSDQSDDRLAEIGAAVERGLTENFHYRYCRTLGQLGPVVVFRVRQSALETYTAGCLARGQRLGDVKSVALHPGHDWCHRFDGYLIPATASRP